jgi:hypothetical protein
LTEEDSNCPEQARSSRDGSNSGEIAPGAKGVVASNPMLVGGEAVTAKLIGAHHETGHAHQDSADPDPPGPSPGVAAILGAKLGRVDHSALAARLLRRLGRERGGIGQPPLAVPL